MERKIFRSETDKILLGVCGGIAEYLKIDPTIIRLAFALFACIGPGIVFYIIAAFIMPKSDFL